MAWTTPADQTTGALITQTLWNQLVDNMAYVPRELDYKQITADLSSSATTEGTATAIITGNSITYDGNRVRIEVWFPHVTPGAAALVTGVLLCDSTVLGRFIIDYEASSTVSWASHGAVFFHTPSAAAHVYKFAMFVDADTATIKAGAGGAGNLLPAFLRVTAAKA